MFRRAMIGRAGNLDQTRPLIQELGRIADAYDLSRAQVALNWLIDYGDTVVAILGASKPKQATQSAAAQTFWLTDTELGRLDDLSR